MGESLLLLGDVPGVLRKPGLLDLEEVLVDGLESASGGSRCWDAEEEKVVCCEEVEEKQSSSVVGGS